MAQAISQAATTSFGPIKQIATGDLNASYAEAGPKFGGAG